jgi:anthranilate synthase component 1
VRVRPDRRSFERSAQGFALAPVWTELLADVSTPVGVFPALAGDGPGILLESVERSERWGRYSFVAGDPAAIVVLDREGLRNLDATDRLTVEMPNTGNPRADLVALASSLRAPRVADLPSLTGGLMGFLSYEAAELLDGHPFPSGDTLGPPIALMLADRAVVFDHWRQRLLLVAHVAPGAYDEGAEALEDLAERLSARTLRRLSPCREPRPTSTPRANPTCPTSATARSSGR